MTEEICASRDIDLALFTIMLAAFPTVLGRKVEVYVENPSTEETTATPTYPCISIENLGDRSDPSRFEGGGTIYDDPPTNVEVELPGGGTQTVEVARLEPEWRIATYRLTAWVASDRNQDREFTNRMPRLFPRQRPVLPLFHLPYRMLWMMESGTSSLRKEAYNDVTIYLRSWVYDIYYGLDLTGEDTTAKIPVVDDEGSVIPSAVVQPPPGCGTPVPIDPGWDGLGQVATDALRSVITDVMLWGRIWNFSGDVRELDTRKVAWREIDE